VAEGLRWTDLVDPSEDELEAALPASLHPLALRLLRAPLAGGDEPRPRIDSHGDYVVGVLLVPVAVVSENRVYYQEIDFILTPERLVTVSKTPPEERPFDPMDAKDACRPDEPIGMYLYRLVDEVAERYLALVDNLNDEIDELEDQVAVLTTAQIRDRISHLRRDLLRVRRTLSPTRDAVRKVVDDRVELDDETFPRDVEVHFADAYDKLLRATEGLDTSRELVAGVRDYFQSKVAIDQNEVMKRLTMIASLLLLPTFIVGLYGQNFREIPELHWGFGYEWSWGLIIVTTAGQLAFFRWKKWL
jgi:magnesium transporter